MGAMPTAALVQLFLAILPMVIPLITQLLQTGQLPSEAINIDLSPEDQATLNTLLGL